MKVKTRRTVVVEYTEKEAKWLKAYLQNSMYDSPSEEPEEHRVMRTRLFSGLRMGLEGTTGWEDRGDE